MSSPSSPGSKAPSRHKAAKVSRVAAGDPTPVPTPPAAAPAGDGDPEAGTRPPTGLEVSTVASFGDRDRRSALTRSCTSAKVCTAIGAGREKEGGVTTVAGIVEMSTTGARRAAA